MDAKEILNNLLATSQNATRKGLEVAEQKLGVPESGPERDRMLDGLGKGALAASAVALLLGTKSGRSLTGTALKVGGVAAVGGLAYKAFTDWQSKQGGAALRDTGTPIGELVGTDASQRSEGIIRAMIAAARADGHIDSDEKLTIASKVESLGLEKDVTSFLLEELSKPVDLDALAASADSAEAAAEMYLASGMVIDLNAPAERAFMDSFAASLKLDPALAKELEMVLA